MEYSGKEARMQATNSVNGAARIGAEANGGRASSWHNGRGWTPLRVHLIYIKIRQVTLIGQ